MHNVVIKVTLTVMQVHNDLLIGWADPSNLGRVPGVVPVNTAGGAFVGAGSLILSGPCPIYWGGVPVSFSGP